LSIRRDAIEAMRPFRAPFLVVEAAEPALSLSNGSAANPDRIDRREERSEILADFN
jgi:hypothetical protein